MKDVDESLSNDKESEKKSIDKEEKVPKKSVSVDTHLSKRFTQLNSRAGQQKIHHQNQQCCSGFSTGNRRFHSDACLIM